MGTTKTRITIQGKPYEVAAHFSQKHEADKYARTRRRLGYYKSVRVVLKRGVYYVCVRRQI